MKIYSLFFLCFIVLNIQPISAQDTLTFLDGKVLVGSVIETNDLTTKVSIKKKNKEKIKEIETINLFDIKYNNGKLDTLYSVNPDQDLLLSTQEMYYFILGEQDAKEYFQPTFNALGGLIFGATFGYLLHEGFYVAGVPLVYTVASGISTIKIKNTGQRSTEVLSHPAYQEGFIKVARTKKAFYALGSSFVGTLTGVAIANGTK